MNNPFKLNFIVGELHSNPILHRYENNPLLTAENVPYKADYVFNAGVAEYRGTYYIAPRVDIRNKHWSPGEPVMDFIGTGFGSSQDGIHFEMSPEMVRVHYQGEILPWVCDARLTVLEDNLYLSFCFENQHSERPGIARWRGGSDFDAVCIGLPQQRNMVLYPEKINGRYMRIERPASQYGDPFHIWYSFSPDMRYWGDSELLLGCEDVPFATRKIGAGAPPVKTNRGWLLIFHAVDEDPARTIVYPGGREWKCRYTSGAALFSPDDPTELIAITRKPLLVAEAPFETGDMKRFWVENTVFPCGAILEKDRNTLRIYYGAGDCNTCLATLKLAELWPQMTPCSRIAKRATIPFRIQDWPLFSR